MNKTPIGPADAAALIKNAVPEVTNDLNDFCQRVFRTRGGRLGSGMGLLLEGLWGYHTSARILDQDAELAWIADHQYNDFACMPLDADWDPVTRKGELLRVETKSMNLGADESKAHFDEPLKNIGDNDLLAVITWSWAADGTRSWPRVSEIFVDQAQAVARLRDRLHLARGGSFVDAAACPDGCSPGVCPHDGEPLNASGKRERIQGPKTRRVSASVSHAANFGGLVRMVKARSAEARSARDAELADNPIARRYFDFIARVVGGAVDVPGGD